MPLIRLTIEYDGSGFHGWQRQPGLRTIQGELERALGQVLRRPVAVSASGRTDAGVHAAGQVVVFEAAELPDLQRLRRSISGLLRGELAVLRAEAVPPQFDVRRDVLCKQYCYTLLNRPEPPVLQAGRVWHVAAKLDLEVMAEAAAQLVGTYDFKSMQGARCGAASTVRTIQESELLSDGALIYYRIVGRGFLKQMVRNIVGTLAALGRGRLTAGSLPAVLAARSRRAAGPTAPAAGLRLDWVRYPVDQWDSAGPVSTPPGHTAGQ